MQGGRNQIIIDLSSEQRETAGFLSSVPIKDENRGSRYTLKISTRLSASFQFRIFDKRAGGRTDSRTDPFLE